MIWIGYKAKIKDQRKSSVEKRSGVRASGEALHYGRLEAGSGGRSGILVVGACLWAEKGVQRFRGEVGE